MNWTISFFNDRVLKGIQKWPVGIYADFLRLDGFIKKTQETPTEELRIGRKRLKDMRNG